MIEIKETLKLPPKGANMQVPFVMLGAKSKADLLTRLQDLRTKKDEPLVMVKMPCCGKKYEFQDHDAFPEKTLPCECGKEGYFVVQYEEEA